MKVGDLIKFTKTGRVATIINIGQNFVDDSSVSAEIFVHGWEPTKHEPKNPFLFRLGYLKEIAEVISEGR